MYPYSKKKEVISTFFIIEAENAMQDKSKMPLYWASSHYVTDPKKSKMYSTEDAVKKALKKASKVPFTRNHQIVSIDLNGERI